jgi:hypothetical protein
MRALPALLAGCAALVITALPASAAEPAGCTGFLWPLGTELAWMEAADAEHATSGATIARPPADRAISLGLKPVSDVAFPVPPTATPKPGDAQSFGGFLKFGAISEGHYQISISSHGWIDVVQNGQTLDPTAHTGAKECSVLRKSVRFEIGSGPVTIEISGAPKDSIRIAVRPAAD